MIVDEAPSTQHCCNTSVDSILQKILLFTLYLFRVAFECCELAMQEGSRYRYADASEARNGRRLPAQDMTCLYPYSAVTSRRAAVAGCLSLSTLFDPAYLDKPPASLRNRDSKLQNKKQYLPIMELFTRSLLASASSRPIYRSS